MYVGGRHVPSKIEKILLHQPTQHTSQQKRAIIKFNHHQPKWFENQAKAKRRTDYPAPTGYNIQQENQPKPEIASPNQSMWQGKRGPNTFGNILPRNFQRAR